MKKYKIREYSPLWVLTRVALPAAYCYIIAVITFGALG